MINQWHSLLSMRKHDKAWHEQDLKDELAEYYESPNLLYKWSELSDLSYTCSRGRWSGHEIVFPFSKWSYVLGILYMLPKYTGRWLFFRKAGKKIDKQLQIREVRNPKKVHKLHHIAGKYNVNPNEFEAVCKKQLRYWLLLP